jgi:hypothetical protein
MSDRQERTKSELEYLCLVALRGRRGLGHLEYVKLRRRRGRGNWTWDLAEIGPDAGKDGMNEAVEVTGILRQYYDMVED